MGFALAKRRPVDWWSLTSSATLSLMWLMLVAVHFGRWRATGQPVGLGLVILETLTAVLFMLRRRPRAASHSVLAWVATGIGSFGPFAVRPVGGAEGGLGILYGGLQFIGVVAAAVSLWSLGRSFGLVAANRGVRVGGPYGLVRHPLYASYLIAHLGYLLENPSLYNCMILSAVWIFQVVRIVKEEEFLHADPAYAAYRARVRYRLVPLVY